MFIEFVTKVSNELSAPESIEIIVQCYADRDNGVVYVDELEAYKADDCTPYSMNHGEACLFEELAIEEYEKRTA